MGTPETSVIGKGKYSTYHRPDCALLAAIPLDYQTTWPSWQDAELDGARPCRKCLKESKGQAKAREAERRDIWERRRTIRKGSPATDAQIEFATALGIDFPARISNGEIGLLIEERIRQFGPTHAEREAGIHARLKAFGSSKK